MQGTLRSGLFNLSIFASGAAVLIVEIVGTRVIGPFFGSTIYSWSALISVTLGFLALGYWVGGRRADANPSYRSYFLVILVAGATTAVVMRIDQPVLLFCDRFGLRFGPLVAALSLFSIPLFFFGMVCPHASRLRAGVVQKVGRGVGGVFAFSTLGSLAGALLAGFVLVPLFSLDFIFTGVGATLIALSALGFLCFESPQQGPTDTGRRLPLLLLFLLLILPTAFLPKIRVGPDRPGVEVGHHTHSRYADLKVLNLAGGRLRCLIGDGAVQSCVHLDREISDFYYVPEVARVIRERKSAKGGDDFRVLLLGLGAGSIASLIPSDVHLDLVEIDEVVVELGREHFGFELGARQTLFVDDARRFLRTTTRRYDVIMCDVFAGSTPPFHLFSREFFELMAGRLEADGLGLLLFVSQPWSGNRYTTSILKTAASVFEAVLLTSPLGRRETRRSDDLLVHLANGRAYRYPSSRSSPYRVVAIDPRGGVVATDAHNPIAEFEFEERAKRRREMLRLYGGYATLFSR